MNSSSGESHPSLRPLITLRGAWRSVSAGLLTLRVNLQDEWRPWLFFARRSFARERGECREPYDAYAWMCGGRECSRGVASSRASAGFRVVLRISQRSSGVPFSDSDGLRAEFGKHAATLMCGAVVGV